MQQHDPGPLMQLFGELERLRKAWTSLGAHGEVSPAQFGTMMRIAYGCKLLACRMDEPWNEGITLSELARMERNSLPATSRRVSPLEEAGFVQREAERDARRVSRVRLTPAGLEALTRQRDDIGRKVHEAFDLLGEEKTATLIRLTGELADALEQTNLGANKLC